jgi:hypothetical protein
MELCLTLMRFDVVRGLHEFSIFEPPVVFEVDVDRRGGDAHAGHRAVANACVTGTVTSMTAVTAVTTTATTRKGVLNTASKRQTRTTKSQRDNALARPTARGSFKNEALNGPDLDGYLSDKHENGTIVSVVLCLIRIHGRFVEK